WRVVESKIEAIGNHAFGFLIVAVLVSDTREGVVGLYREPVGEPPLQAEEARVVYRAAAVGAHPERRHLIIRDGSRRALGVDDIKQGIQETLRERGVLRSGKARCT